MFHRRKCPKCKDFAFVTKQIDDQKKEIKVKEMYFLYNKRIYLPQFFLPCFFSHIHSYLYYLCFFPPLELRCLFPLFCFLYSLIFTVFNSIIPTLGLRDFPELMDSQELEDKRPCNLNSSLKKTLKRKLKSNVHTNTKNERVK